MPLTKAQPSLTHFHGREPTCPDSTSTSAVPGITYRWEPSSCHVPLMICDGDIKLGTDTLSTLRIAFIGTAMDRSPSARAAGHEAKKGQRPETLSTAG